VLNAYIEYAERQIASGVRLNHLARHIVGLYHGQPSGRVWRRHISENAHLPKSDTRILRRAHDLMQSNVEQLENQLQKSG